jgi:hypothetical protein
MLRGASDAQRLPRRRDSRWDLSAEWAERRSAELAGAGNTPMISPQVVVAAFEPDGVPPRPESPSKRHRSWILLQKRAFNRRQICAIVNRVRQTRCDVESL